MSASDDDLGLSADQSTVMALRHAGRGKLIALGAVTVATASVGAFLLLGPSSSRGAPDEPNRVLIVGPDSSDLANWLQRQGFSAEQRTYASAVTAGQDLDPALDGMHAVSAFADEHGFGYVAMHPPGIYELGDMGEGGETIPPGATMAIIAVGDLAKQAPVTYGVPSAAVAHPAPYGQQVGLILGLFEQPRLARIAEGEVASADLAALAELKAKGALEHSRRLIAGQRAFDKLALGWDAATGTPNPPMPMVALGGAFEKLDAYPLANGGVLVLTTEPGWHTQDGYRAELGNEQKRYARYIKPGDVGASPEDSLATRCAHVKCTTWARHTRWGRCSWSAIACGLGSRAASALAGRQGAHSVGARPRAAKRHVWRQRSCACVRVARAGAHGAAGR